MIVEYVEIVPVVTHPIESAPLPALEELDIPTHHYPFQGTLTNIFEPKPCHEDHVSLHDENESPIDKMLYHFNYRQWVRDQIASWSNFDVEAATAMTRFKDDYILSLGDIRLRSTCMFVSAGLFYLLLSLHKPTVLSRVRNLGVSFVLNGYLWVPELFNPLLIWKRG